VPETENLEPGSISDGLEIEKVTDIETGEDITVQFKLRLYPVGETESNWQDSGILSARLSLYNS
jgi:hypothetical protein